ncbi:unnamed protein product [Coccothraustes coccothraustes]
MESCSLHSCNTLFGKCHSPACHRFPRQASVAESSRLPLALRPREQRLCQQRGRAPSTGQQPPVGASRCPGTGLASPPSAAGHCGPRGRTGAEQGMFYRCSGQFMHPVLPGEAPGLGACSWADPAAVVILLLSCLPWLVYISS